MRQSSFPLPLASSLQEEARKTAGSEGISLNQLINLAVARENFCLAYERVLSGAGSSGKCKESTQDFEARRQGSTTRG